MGGKAIDKPNWIARCAVCNNSFERYNRNSKLCDKCRQAAYSKRFGGKTQERCRRCGFKIRKKHKFCAKCKHWLMRWGNLTEEQRKDVSSFKR